MSKKLRVMSFNCQAGEHGTELVDFILRKAAQNDIVMLQEVHRCIDPNAPDGVMAEQPAGRKNPIQIKLFDRLAMGLTRDFDCYFAPQLCEHLHDLEPCKYNVQYGNAMFVRKTLVTAAYESAIIHRTFGKPNDGKEASAKSMQVVCVIEDGVPTLVAHFHGFWTQMGKIDVEERFAQNEQVLAVLRRQATRFFVTGERRRIVLMGDFNYTSKMEALKELVGSSVFGNQGGIHLNRVFQIVDTRTRHYPPQKPSREADHAIVSTGFDIISSFVVDNEAPSDHATLEVVV